jgi:hypothetical protein
MPGPPQPRQTNATAGSIPPSPSRLQQAKSGSYPCWPFRARHQMSRRGGCAGSAPGCASRGLEVPIRWLSSGYHLAMYTIRTPSVHHPYTIRTPSAHHPHKIRTPCQCAMPWLAPRVRLACHMVGPLGEGPLARKDNEAREGKPTGRLGFQPNPRCLAEINHISGPGAGPVSGLCFAVFDSG